MLLVNPLEDMGDLRGAIYDFIETGDILPKHLHTEFDTHITIVARGRIKAYSHDWEVEAVAGQVLNFRAGEPHEIIGLEENTRIFTIMKKMGGTYAAAYEMTNTDKVG